MNTPISTALTVALAASSSLATVTNYDNRALFNADAGALSLEDFNSESLGSVATPSTFDSGLGIDFASGGVSAYIGAGDPDSYGFQNTVGLRKYLAFGQTTDGIVETGSYSVAFSFSGASATAFGFDLSGFQPTFAADGLHVTTLMDGQVMDDDFLFSDQMVGEANFYGFLSDSAFNEIRIFIPTLPGEADYTAFDGIVWNTVPAPSGAAFLALSGLAVTRRRR